MVLGANLKPLKTKELMDLASSKYTRTQSY